MFSSCPSLKLAAYFFPIVFAIPLFGKYLAREWLWSFTPSLSYVGQGACGFVQLRVCLDTMKVLSWVFQLP
jgi:hypothetical protein